jgi:kynurenine formamidase
MTHAAPTRAWTGWSSPASGETGWIDLTHAITASVPRLEKFDAPRIRKVASMPEDANSVTALEIVCHTGTHLDAPCHFILGAPAIDQIPLQRLMGPGVIVRPDLGSRHEVRASDLAASDVRAGDIAILDTGWWRVGGGDGEHPCLDEEAAWWLVERGVKVLATDLPTPDLAGCRRRPDFDWPVHRILLGHGVLIAENLTNLGLAPGRVEAMLLPLPIAGSDGSPARVLARAIDRPVRASDRARTHVAPTDPLKSSANG